MFRDWVPGPIGSTGFRAHIGFWAFWGEYIIRFTGWQACRFGAFMYVYIYICYSQDSLKTVM